MIEKYIQENHKEPGTDEELDVEDLLPIKTNRIVRPRPPQFTSLPSMLKAFQDEWDALVLESYNTRQQLARTREELATALYQNDAAVRVIARLTKERDEAREALSRLTVTASAGGAATGDAMAVDSEGLPEALAAHVDQVQAEYFTSLHHLARRNTDNHDCRKQKGRKKRPVPEGWATTEDVSALQQTAYTDLPVTQATSLALNAGYAAVGGLDGIVDLYSVEAKAHERSLEIGEPVTATVWIGNKVVSATSKGSVKAVEGGVETGSVTEHAGAVTGLAVHPGEQILASVGVDKGIIFYDLHSLQRVARVYTDAGMYSISLLLSVQLTNNHIRAHILRLPPRRPPLRRRHAIRPDRDLRHQDPPAHGQLHPRRPRQDPRLLRKWLLVRRHRRRPVLRHRLRPAQGRRRGAGQGAPDR